MAQGRPPANQSIRLAHESRWPKKPSYTATQILGGLAHLSRQLKTAGAYHQSVETLISEIDEHGWSVIDDFITTAEVHRLRDECETAYQVGEFRPAGIGRGEKLQVQPEIRQDQVMWIQPGELSPEQAHYLSRLEGLRQAINQRFYLGLFDFEGHFAIYPEGAFYKAHLDRHSGTHDRLITVILYLNDNWQPGDGGELKIWTSPEGRDGPYKLIEPRMGTLVCFFSGDFWHEVLPASKTRMSITGWFRQRA